MLVFRHVILSLTFVVQLSRSTLEHHDQLSFNERMAAQVKRCMDDIYKQENDIKEMSKEYELMSKILMEVITCDSNLQIDEYKSFATKLNEPKKDIGNDKSKMLIEKTLGQLEMFYKKSHEKLDEIKGKLEILNESLGCGVNFAFTLNDARQKYMVLLKAKMCEVRAIYDKMISKLDAHSKKCTVKASLLDALKKEFEVMCAEIANCILELENADSMLGHTVNTSDSFLIGLNSRINTYLRLYHSLGRVRQTTVHVRRETNNCDDFISDFLDITKTLMCLADFKANELTLEFNRIKSEAFKAAIENGKNPIPLIINELENMILFTTDLIKYSISIAKIFNGTVQYEIQFLQITDAHYMSYMIRTIQTLIDPLDLLYIFNDFINTFCMSSSDESDMSKNQYEVKRCIKNVLEFEDYLGKYFKFAMEYKAQNVEFMIVAAEIQHEFFNLKYCIIKLRITLALLYDTRDEEISLDYQNLVNTLSLRIFTAFGTVNALVKAIKQEKDNIEKQNESIAKMLKKQSLALIQYEKASPTINSPHVSKLKDKKAALTEPETSSNETSFEAKTYVEKILKKLNDDRLERYNTRNYNVQVATQFFDERKQANETAVNTEQYRNLQIKADEVQAIIDVVTTDMNCKDAIDEADIDIMPDFDIELDLLNMIHTVYREDMEFICLQANLACIEIQKKEYNNKVFQSQQIRLLASIDMELLYLHSKMLLSRTTKVKLTTKIKEANLQVLQSICGSLTYETNFLGASGKEVCCWLSKNLTVIQKRIILMAKAVNEFTKFYNIDVHTKNEKHQAQDNQKEISDSIKADVRILGLFIDKYLKQEDLTIANNQDHSTLEATENFCNWLIQFGKTCNEIKENIFAKIQKPAHNKLPESRLGAESASSLVQRQRMSTAGRYKFQNQKKQNRGPENEVNNPHNQTLDNGGLHPQKGALYKIKGQQGNLKVPKQTKQDLNDYDSHLTTPKRETEIAMSFFKHYSPRKVLIIVIFLLLVIAGLVFTAYQYYTWTKNHLLNLD